MNESEIFIVGANGQLGTALREKYPGAKFADIAELDITNKKSVESFDWSDTSIILNAAAYTNVDGAETINGRITSWSVNASAVANLVSVAQSNNIVLLHISSDYVFDGTQDPHTENEQLSPLSVYGSSKAAGDIIVSMLKKYYILRTTWVIGDGKNFVRTMLDLAKKGVSPTVVADQFGRLTFTDELVRAIDHLLTTRAKYGTYNITNDGPLTNWANISRLIFQIAGYDNLQVTDTTTAEYSARIQGVAHRPLMSNMNLDKIHATGFQSHDWQEDLKSYIKKEKTR